MNNKDKTKEPPSKIKKTLKPDPESENFYRTVFENAGIATVIFKKDSTILLINGEFEKLSGYTREEVEGKKKLNEFVAGEGDLKQIIKHHLQNFADPPFAPASRIYEFQLVNRSEQAKDIVATVTIIPGTKKTLLTLLDITERKRMEAALKESQRQLADIIEFLPDPTYAIDLSGKVIAWNHAVEEMTGVKAEDMLGKGDHEYIIPFYGTARPVLIDLVFESNEELEKKYNFVEREGDVLLAEAEVPVRGKPHILWGKAGPLYDSNGHVIGAIESVRDITALKLAEKALQKAHDELELRVQERTAELEQANEALRKEISERKLAEEARKSSEDKYRQIFECATEGIYQSTPEGIYLNINPAFARMHGYASPQEMIDFVTNIGEQHYVNPKVREELVRLLHEHDSVEGYEVEIYRKDKSKFWISINSHTVRDAWGNVLYFEGTNADITARKKAEEALKRSEHLYRAIFENTGVANILVREDTIIILANSEFEKLSGFSKEEIEGEKSWTEFFVHEDLSRMLQYHQLRRMGKEGVLRKYECRLKDRHGHIKDIAISVDMIPSTKESIASLHDITERKQAERTLQESQRRLADIIDFLPDATLVIDKEGKVIAWNRAMEAMTGVKKEDMLGKGDHEYAMPFYGDRRNILVDLVLHPEREIKNNYMAIQRVGDILLGEALTKNLLIGNIHISGTASVLRDNSGEAIAAIECIRDNTERKKLAERLNRAEKMEALGTLAGGVAHDLNNVLGVLVGYSELLAESLPEDSFERKYAVNIQKSSEKGAAIIQDLLTLARRGVTVSEVVDLNRLVLDYFKTPEFEKLKSYHKDVKIRTDFEEKLLLIKGSPIHLGKTIMNMVSNALEAVPGYGEVTIKTTNHYLDHPVRGYDAIQEGDYVVLTVSDTGRGISANDLSKIFEPFYTKKVMGRSGTGLGLAVVWGTAKDHNGYIDVQSEEGKGSTFTLYFPATREELEQIEKAVSSVSYMGNGESILVVDDIQAQRELAVRMLSKLGYRVESAAGGEEAIDYLKTKKVDLLILDMIMYPGIDGMETYRRILEINPKQKAVIVSGFSETDRVRKAQEMGAGAFVRKPYILERIGYAVKKVLDQKQHEP